ncbi:hypothetical protein JCM14076_12170 [Methylosoma difficile]
MSYKTRLIKMAVKWTPKSMVVWVANKVLKGIAELSDFSVDLDTRKVYAKTTLYGESEAIEVWLEDFSISTDGESYHFNLQHARSNRPWLTNIMAYVVGRAWKIPVTPQLQAYVALVADLLKAEQPVVEEIA